MASWLSPDTTSVSLVMQPGHGEVIELVLKLHTRSGQHKLLRARVLQSSSARFRSTVGTRMELLT